MLRVRQPAALQWAPESRAGRCKRESRRSRPLRQPGIRPNRNAWRPGYSQSSRALRQTICRWRRIIRQEPDVDPLNSFRRGCDNPYAEVGVERVAGAWRVTAVSAAKIAVTLFVMMNSSRNAHHGSGGSRGPSERRRTNSAPEPRISSVPDLRPTAAIDFTAWSADVPRRSHS